MTLPKSPHMYFFETLSLTGQWHFLRFWKMSLTGQWQLLRGTIPTFSRHCHWVVNDTFRLRLSKNSEHNLLNITINILQNEDLDDPDDRYDHDDLDNHDNPEDRWVILTEAEGFADWCWLIC